MEDETVLFERTATEPGLLLKKVVEAKRTFGNGVYYTFVFVTADGAPRELTVMSRPDGLHFMDVGVWINDHCISMGYKLVKEKGKQDKAIIV